MRTLREIVGGLLLASITLFTVLGGIFLAVSESGESYAPLSTEAAPASSPTPQLPAPTHTPVLAITDPPTPAAATETPTHTAAPTTQLPDTPTPLPTTLPTDTPAPPPTDLPAARPTDTATPCGPPPTWVPYIVKPGDTLFKLSLQFRTSVAQIQLANCLTDAEIKYGQRLFVPFVPAPTPSATPASTPTPFPTDTPVPEKLRITGVTLIGVTADTSRPNGAIASIHVDFTGGAPPYTVYNDDVAQPGSTIQSNTECGGTLIHTVRVDSADGQSASQTYYFSPIVCP